MQVDWSPSAEKSYLKIVVWIIENWSVKSAEEFADKTDKLIYSISVHKKLCPVSKTNKKLRRCLVSPQTSLVYQIKRRHIEIIAFFDNRSDHKH